MPVGRCMGMFYADDVMVVSKDPEWLQGDINVLIRLFRRVELMENVEKSNTMTCHTWAIHMGMLEETFSQRSEVEGDTYQESLRRRIP